MGSRSNHSGSKKCGKTVAQLGEQTVQSIAPLKVNTEQQQVIITDEQREFSRDAGLTIEQFLNLDGVSGVPDEKRKYVTGEPMVN